MIADAETVARKEMKEIVVQRTGGKGRQSFWRTAIIPIVIGILFGFQTANGNGAFAVFPIGFFAMTSAAAMITDAIAGERERHTLETLLASPVSDSAILLGKIAAVVAYAWAIALVQLAGVWGTSIAIGHGLSPGLVLVVAVLALLEAVLAAGFGVQLSMRAPDGARRRPQARGALVPDGDPDLAAERVRRLGARRRLLRVDRRRCLPRSRRRSTPRVFLIAKARFRRCAAPARLTAPQAVLSCHALSALKDAPQSIGESQVGHSASSSVISDWQCEHRSLGRVPLRRRPWPGRRAMAGGSFIGRGLSRKFDRSSRRCTPASALRTGRKSQLGADALRPASATCWAMLAMSDHTFSLLMRPSRNSKTCRRRKVTWPDLPTSPKNRPSAMWPVQSTSSTTKSSPYQRRERLDAFTLEVCEELLVEGPHRGLAGQRPPG